MGPYGQQQPPPAFVTAALRQAVGNAASINGTSGPPAARLLAQGQYGAGAAGSLQGPLSMQPQLPTGQTSTPPIIGGTISNGHLGQSDRFLKDLAQVVPSLDLSQMRGSQLLQSLLQNGAGVVGNANQPLIPSRTASSGVRPNGSKMASMAPNATVGLPTGTPGFPFIVGEPLQPPLDGPSFHHNLSHSHQPKHPPPQSINLTPHLAAGDAPSSHPPTASASAVIGSMAGMRNNHNPRNNQMFHANNFGGRDAQARGGRRGGGMEGPLNHHGANLPPFRPPLAAQLPAQQQRPTSVTASQLQHQQELKQVGRLNSGDQAAAAKEAADVLKEMIRNSLAQQDQARQNALLSQVSGRGPDLGRGRGGFRGNRGGRGGGFGAAEWKSQPSIPTYGTPSADCMVARSMLKAQPSPFKPPVKLGNGAELTWDEEDRETRWFIDDQAVFYRTGSLQPSAEYQGKRNFHDLNIVMPIVLPSAEIRVHNVDGENYYNLSHRDLGAHLLFGRDSLPAVPEGTDKTILGSPPTADTEPDNQDAKKAAAESKDAAGEGAVQGNSTQTDHSNFVVVPPLHIDETSPPAVCDVWASFLHIQLGVLRNCRAEQIPEIVRLFHKAFTEDHWTSFPTPIEIECKGIYPGAASETHAKGGDSEGSSFERYETRGTFVGDIDRRRFRIIRRRLKKFLFMLWDQFGVDAGGPRFDAALSLNCKTGENDFVRVEIRRYSPLIHSGLLKHIWSEQPASARAADAAPVEAIVAVKLSETAAPVIPRAKIMASEVRLEMTHARMIDPRWTKQWVLARRMPALPATTATSRPLLARHVFAPKSNIANLPTVVYEFPNPKSALLQSRFSPLYLLADVVCRDAEAAAAEAIAVAHKAIKEDPAVLSVNKQGSIHQAALSQAPHASNLSTGTAAVVPSLPTPGLPAQSSAGGTGSSAVAQENSGNSNLKATAVPFYPLATVLHTITQPAGTTAWDKLVTMAGSRLPAGPASLVAAPSFPLHPTIADFDGTKEVDGQAILNAIFNHPCVAGVAMAGETGGSNASAAATEPGKPSNVGQR